MSETPHQPDDSDGSTDPDLDVEGPNEGATSHQPDPEDQDGGDDETS